MAATPRIHYLQLEFLYVDCYDRQNVIELTEQCLSLAFQIVKCIESGLASCIRRLELMINNDGMLISY